MIPRTVRTLLLLLLAVISVGGVRIIYKNDSQNIAIKPLTLDPANPGVRRVGDLIFLEAWELGSDNSDFGGISALTALPGNRFVGVSDAGTLIGFGLTRDDRIDRPFIAPLPGSQGPDINYKDRDSEGIAYDPDSGQFWVSYEAKHAIRRFSRSFSRLTGKIDVKSKHVWPNNKGLEALIRLPDGRFIAIAENLEEGKHEGFLYSGDPVEPGTSITSFEYRPPDGYRVTDGTVLPDGRVLILNRSVSFPQGFATKLAVVETADFKTGNMASGKVIASLAAPLLIDNMEGVTITRDGNDTIIWLISDNNFSIWQRTLLMKFRLSERNPKKKPDAAPAPGFNSI